MSAGPTNRPRSEGLMGLASTLTRTSSGPGSGTGTLTSDSSSSPFLRIRDLSSRAVAVPLLIWLLPLNARLYHGRPRSARPSSLERSSPAKLGKNSGERERERERESRFEREDHAGR